MSDLHQQLESPRQVAERLGWPLARVRKLIRAKQIRHVKVGGIYLLPQGALEEYLEANTVEPLPKPASGG
ncbi:excisionase family DNA-binding protein [Phaeobacter inhibens]|uniref:excisionase family DNA-binding protein n=1 Tax=Phaeobacter inhibens TaxID=221822 RepID=UPI002207BAED|nr:helix-turn-helix domain-containing protein [Phaeobacter inhibens]UWR79072.1 helix-turn-helix domain-containing protein [Phaeobacter inhibens]